MEWKAYKCKLKVPPSCKCCEGCGERIPWGTMVVVGTGLFDNSVYHVKCWNKYNPDEKK